GADFVFCPVFVAEHYSSLLFVYPSDYSLLGECHQIGDEIIERQTCGERVQHEQENQWHDVGHRFHRSLYGAELIVLPGIDQRRDRHQQREQAEVITHAKRDGKRQVDDGIVRRQVFRPKERLLAQFNARRKEIEHREQDRHLQQHRNTSTDRIHTYLLVQL